MTVGDKGIYEDVGLSGIDGPREAAEHALQQRGKQ